MSVQAKFITKLMRKGKKEKSEQILIKALKKVEQEIQAWPQTGKNNNKISFSKILTKGELPKISVSSVLSVTWNIFDQIINNAKPLVRLKKVRIAGTTHQKPIALTKKQAETDAIKRIITNANKRSEKSITLKLAKEFEEIYFNVLSNKTLTEIRDLHKLAEINKANLTLKS